MDWLREKESNLHLRVQSPTCCQLHHPAKSGYAGRRPASVFLTVLIEQAGGLRTQVWSRWKELNRHRSIINRVLWPLSYTAKEVAQTLVCDLIFENAESQTKVCATCFG